MLIRFKCDCFLEDNKRIKEGTTAKVLAVSEKLNKVHIGIKNGILYSPRYFIPLEIFKICTEEIKETKENRR